MYTSHTQFDSWTDEAKKSRYTELLAIGEAYIAEQQADGGFPDITDALQTFLAPLLADGKSLEGKKVAVVTSGGTIIPLEQNMVRFLDNFSGGNRGSASAEAFLAAGYHVIFLTRKGSCAPFARHLQLHIKSLHIDNTFMEHLEVGEDGVLYLTETRDTVDPSGERLSVLKAQLAIYKQVMQEKRLLTLKFEPLGQYLSYLAAIAKAVAPLGKRALMYFCAAVSDFYIPRSQLAQHKIQSSTGPLTLTLPNTPKMLGCLRYTWAPQSFCVSFKLETDENLLLSKSRTAIQNYGMNVVVANELHSRKEKVMLVTAEDTTLVTNQQANGDLIEIEIPLITNLVQRHTAFCNSDH